MGEYLWGDHWNSGRTFKNSVSSYVNALRDASVQFSHSVLSDSCNPMDFNRPGFPVHHWLLEPTQTCPLSWWCYPTISSSVVLFSSRLQSFPASGSFPMRPHQVAKVLEFQLQHQSFQSIFRTDFLWMDFFDLLAVQGTLKSLRQHRSPKELILWHSAFFMVQLSHLYMTTGKTIALTRQTFVSKVMSLLSNMLLGLSWLSLRAASVF